ncbi:NUDIX hydrolase [Nocardioides sp. GCM10027113]|uniref:NUDIX hydrolase n=1 Tax=unclassified Nocardioides TaxID=2615069 RepID=UPI00360A340F
MVGSGSTSRKAVKVLLLDPDDRVLLLSGREDEHSDPFWFPVGGGIEPGEDAATAARREVAEETGLGDLRLGQEVWTRRSTYAWRGESRVVEERWFVARTERFEPSGEAMTPDERGYVTGFRWWTVADLAASSASVFPADLASRLGDLLLRGVPSAPIDISSGKVST